MKIDLIFQIFFTLFTIILIPIYWKNYGPKNFLWLSDIGLFITLFALLFRSSLLISIACVGLLPLEILWNLDFFIHLILGYNISGLSNYMFENKYSNLLKVLSLFHVLLPPVWIYYLIKWGYNKNAFANFLLIFWIIMILSYLFSTKDENINWVFSPKKIRQKNWFLILMIGLPLFIFLPMHFLLIKL